MDKDTRYYIKEGWKKRKQKEQPCLHLGCPKCHGTGWQDDGTICVHFLSCPCPRCTPRF